MTWDIRRTRATLPILGLLIIGLPAFAAEQETNVLTDFTPLSSAGFSNSLVVYTPPSPSTNALPSTASNNPVPPEVDYALARAHDTLASSNVLVSRAPSEERAELEKYQARLAAARVQKEQKDYTQAEKTFAEILNSPAPREITRSALLELALMAQERKQLTRAQQIYGQFLANFREDASVPEVLLRQGLIYREMGAPVMALSKFYCVMSSALTLKVDQLAYYQRLVLQAQTEIAETYYLAGRFQEAADYLGRLLKLESTELNREQILYKLVRSLSSIGRNVETLAQAELFLSKHPNSDQVPEVRFILADALRRLGRKREALEAVLGLMKDQRSIADRDSETWRYWQQRAGNEIANYLYTEGDALGALEIYLRLAELNTAPEWRVPAWYQAGLVYEHLKQSEKADDLYGKILEEGKELEKGGTVCAPSLKLVLDMAQWRKQHLAWQMRADVANRQINASIAPAQSAQ